MKVPSLLLCLVLVCTLNCYGARVVVTVPPNIAEVQMLSGGTSAVLEHLRTRFSSQVSSLEEYYRLRVLTQKVEQTSNLREEQKKGYTDKVSSLRNDYISRLTFSIGSINAAISPESSSLGDIMFYYTVHNGSDRIITDITFRPSVDSMVLPTTTTLVLEFIHPQTLKLGLAPGETMTNNGHDPERFQFFIGNLSQEVLQQIRSDLRSTFAIEVLDLHFSSQKGYKGHIRVMDVEDAFEAQLKPVQNSLMKTETELASRRNALARAQEAYISDRGRVMEEYTSAVENLKRSSLRYKSAVDSKKGRSTFEDIDVGTYLLYATNTTGEAIFEEIIVHEGKNQFTIQTLREDPFLP